MIRLLIIGAIFYVGYQIGADGYDDFVSDIDFKDIESKMANLFESIGDIIGKLNS